MIIDINDQTDTLTTSQVQLLKNVLSFATKREKIAADAELSLTIVTNEEIREMNREYRKKNEPTDVLSFPMEESFINVEGDSSLPLLLGDIIISIEKVKEQSMNYHHSFERELAFLSIHGFLHLIGYTHDNKEDEKRMFQKQDLILEEFNLER